MKRLWMILSVLAIANVLAFAGFVGWLVKGDRLDKARVEKIRTMLATTISAEKASAEEAVKQEEVAKTEAAAAERMAQPPVPAAQVIAVSQQAQDLDVQTTLRKQRELEDLRASLLRLQTNLEEREVALTKAREEFEETKNVIGGLAYPAHKYGVVLYENA